MGYRKYKPINSMMDARHNYLSMVYYSTMIYLYYADGRDLYESLECEGWHKHGYDFREVYAYSVNRMGR
jgi:hypothetical protein